MRVNSINAIAELYLVRLVIVVAAFYYAFGTGIYLMIPFWYAISRTYYIFYANSPQEFSDGIEIIIVWVLSAGFFIYLGWKIIFSGFLVFFLRRATIKPKARNLLLYVILSIPFVLSFFWVIFKIENGFIVGFIPGLFVPALMNLYVYSKIRNSQ